MNIRLLITSLKERWFLKHSHKLCIIIERQKRDMAIVSFTTALKRFFPDLNKKSFSGENVAEVLAEVEKEFPGIREYLLDEQGELRKHINIFLRGELIADRIELSDSVGEQDEVLVFQALSGG